MAGKKSDLGPTGMSVAQNVGRLREVRGLGYAELSRKLAELGREIPPLGLRRIESQQRRVDADDLAALAVALDVSPITLLLPAVADGSVPVAVTGFDGELSAEKLWAWLTAHDTLPQIPQQIRAAGPLTQMMFRSNAWPTWRHDVLRSEHRERIEQLLGYTDGND